MSYPHHPTDRPSRDHITHLINTSVDMGFVGPVVLMVMVLGCIIVQWCKGSLRHGSSPGEQRRTTGTTTTLRNQPDEEEGEELQELTHMRVIDDGELDESSGEDDRELSDLTASPASPASPASTPRVQTTHDTQSDDLEDIAQSTSGEGSTEATKLAVMEHDTQPFTTGNPRPVRQTNDTPDIAERVDTHSNDRVFIAGHADTHSNDSVLIERADTHSDDSVFIAGHADTHSNDSVFIAEHADTHSNDSVFIEEQADTHSNDSVFMATDLEDMTCGTQGDDRACCHAHPGHTYIARDTELSSQTDDDMSDYLAALVLNVTDVNTNDITESPSSRRATLLDDASGSDDTEGSDDSFSRLQDVQAQASFSPYHLAWSTPRLPGPQRSRGRHQPQSSRGRHQAPSSLVAKNLNTEMFLLARQRLVLQSDKDTDQSVPSIALADTSCDKHASYLDFSDNESAGDCECFGRDWGFQCEDTDDTDNTWSTLVSGAECRSSPHHPSSMSPGRSAAASSYTDEDAEEQEYQPLLVCSVAEYRKSRLTKGAACVDNVTALQHTPPNSMRSMTPCPYSLSSDPSSFPCPSSTGQSDSAVFKVSQRDFNTPPVFGSEDLEWDDQEKTPRHTQGSFLFSVEQVHTPLVDFEDTKREMDSCEGSGDKATVMASLQTDSDTKRETDSCEGSVDEATVMASLQTDSDTTVMASLQTDSDTKRETDSCEGSVDEATVMASLQTDRDTTVMASLQTDRDTTVMASLQTDRDTPGILQGQRSSDDATNNDAVFFLSLQSSDDATNNDAVFFLSLQSSVAVCQTSTSGVSSSLSDMSMSGVSDKTKPTNAAKAGPADTRGVRVGTADSDHHRQRDGSPHLSTPSPPLSLDGGQPPVPSSTPRRQQQHGELDPFKTPFPVPTGTQRKKPSAVCPMPSPHRVGLPRSKSSSNHPLCDYPFLEPMTAPAMLRRSRTSESICPSSLSVGSVGDMSVASGASRLSLHEESLLWDNEFSAAVRGIPNDSLAWEDDPYLA